MSKTTAVNPSGSTAFYSDVVHETKVLSRDASGQNIVLTMEQKWALVLVLTERSWEFQDYSC